MDRNEIVKKAKEIKNIVADNEIHYTAVNPYLRQQRSLDTLIDNVENDNVDDDFFYKALDVQNEVVKNVNSFSRPALYEPIIEQINDLVNYIDPDYPPPSDDDSDDGEDDEGQVTIDKEALNKALGTDK